MQAPAIRRLAAILVADIAGYSRLIGLDEEGTLARLGEIRADLFDPKILEHRGRITRTTGDGLLVDFASAVDALRCAVAVQAEMERRNAAFPAGRRIEWRIGINAGDIVVASDDIFGDGVNIAARLETLASPGGICVSARVQEDTVGKVDVAFEDLGQQQLRNIARPVRVYRVHADGRDPVRTAALPLPDRPSIAVLPFTDMSSSKDQEFFADGIAEDILTALSKSRSLFVIARNSSFTYKNRAASVASIGRELGVGYILEGSVRRAGNRVRVTAQLIDVASSGHLWAERYDRELADIFAVQDEITTSVSAAIQPALERSERERAARKAPDSLDAWECYHRGMWHFANIEPDENDKARAFFRRATELDPRFAQADAALALTYLNEITLFRAQARTANLPLALAHAGRAVKNDPADATAHAALARALWMSGRHRESLGEADLAVGLDPNSAAAHAASGGARLWGGLPRDAIMPLQTALRLSPFDPLMPLWRHFMARARYWAGEYEEAVTIASQLRHSFPNFRQPYNTLIAALGQVGRSHEARAVLIEALARFGDSFHRSMALPLHELRELRPSDRDHMIDGFRKAGLAD